MTRAAGVCDVYALHRIVSWHMLLSLRQLENFPIDFETFEMCKVSRNYSTFLGKSEPVEEAGV